MCCPNAQARWIEMCCTALLRSFSCFPNVSLWKYVENNKKYCVAGSQRTFLIVIMGITMISSAEHSFISKKIKKVVYVLSCFLVVMFVRWWFPVPVLHTHNDDFLCQVSVCMITISCACVDCCVVGFQCTTSQNWCITVLTCCRMTRCACTSNSCPRLVSPGRFLKVLINPGKVSLAASLWDGLVGYFLLVLPSLCVCVCVGLSLPWGTVPCSPLHSSEVCTIFHCYKPAGETSCVERITDTLKKTKICIHIRETMAD